MSVVRPRLHHHCPYQHYQMLHRNSGSDYGNSVFNYTYNFNGGNICGGGFWGGIWGGIGMGIGNFLGGLLGGCFGGGFGFGGGMMTSPFSMFGNSTLFNPTNFWNIGNKDKADGAGGSEKARKNRKAKETEKAKEDSEVKPEKKTQETENDALKKEYDALLEKPDLKAKEAEDFLNKNRSNLTEEQIENLSKKISELKAKEAEEAKKAEEARKKEEQAKLDDKKFGAEDWNGSKNQEFSNIKVDLDGFTNCKNKAVTKENLVGAFDNHEGKIPTPVKEEVEDISESKFVNGETETTFPRYICIREGSGKRHRYKCIGVTDEGYAVYRTPNGDRNNNQYILAYDPDNDQFRLTQEGLGEVAEAWGKGSSDTQEDYNPADEVEETDEEDE